MYKALYDPATLPSSVVSVPSPILFLVYSILATTLASLVEHTKHAAASGPLLVLFSLTGISSAQDSYHKFRAPHFFQEHCSNVFWSKRLILFDPKALSKTASLPSYHSLSYLRTLFLFLFCFFLFLMHLSPSGESCLFTYCLSTQQGRTSFCFVHNSTPSTWFIIGIQKNKKQNSWIWWKNMDGFMMLKAAFKLSNCLNPSGLTSSTFLQLSLGERLRIGFLSKYSILTCKRVARCFYYISLNPHNNPFY